MARQVSQAKQQMLRIGFVPVAEMKIFPFVLPNLRVQNPDLKIELLSLNNTEQMKMIKKVNSISPLPATISTVMKLRASLYCVNR